MAIDRSTLKLVSAREKPGADQFFVEERAVGINVSQNAAIAVSSLAVELDRDVAAFDPAAGELGGLRRERMFAGGRVDSDQPQGDIPVQQQRVAIINAGDMVGAGRLEVEIARGRVKPVPTGVPQSRGQPGRAPNGFFAGESAIGMGLDAFRFSLRGDDGSRHQVSAGERSRRPQSRQFSLKFSRRSASRPMGSFRNFL